MFIEFFKIFSDRENISYTYLEIKKTCLGKNATIDHFQKSKFSGKFISTKTQKNMRFNVYPDAH
jgi:hypothetical protein